MVDIQKTIVGRLNARFHLPKNADFTLWVCVVQATCPRPDRWPTVYAAIAEKWMVTKQHKSPRDNAHRLYVASIHSGNKDRRGGVTTIFCAPSAA
jgi:hypothetical protein